MAADWMRGEDTKVHLWFIIYGPCDTGALSRNHKVTIPHVVMAIDFISGVGVVYNTNKALSLCRMCPQMVRYLSHVFLNGDLLLLRGNISLFQHGHHGNIISHLSSGQLLCC